MDITMEEQFKPHVSLATLVADSVRIRRSHHDLWNEMQIASRRLRQRYHDREPSEIEELEPAREMFRALGLDPTRFRPSSESLLRRAQKATPIHITNTVVDMINLYSLLWFVPMGVYDARRVKAPVEFRRGRPGEQYGSLSKDRMNLEGMPVLADAEGPFGGPISDSTRTMITLDSTHLLVVLFVPSRISKNDIEYYLEQLGKGISSYASGAVANRQIISV